MVSSCEFKFVRERIVVTTLLDKAKLNCKTKIMKTKFIIILFLLGICSFLSAQGQHTYKPTQCMLGGKPVSWGVDVNRCPACLEIVKKEEAAKAKEDQRVKEIAIKKAEEKEKKEQFEIKRKEEEKKEKERIAQEAKKNENERKKAEIELRSKLIEQTRKNNDERLANVTGNTEINLQNVKIKENEVEIEMEYDGIPLKKFSKQNYKFVTRIDNTNVFCAITIPDNKVPFTTLYPDSKGYTKNASLIKVHDALGNEKTSFKNIYDFAVNDGNKTVVFYEFLSEPAFIRLTSTDGGTKPDYRKVMGFYINESDARSAIESYMPLFEQVLNLPFFIIKVKAITTDYNLKTIREEVGFLVARGQKYG